MNTAKILIIEDQFIPAFDMRRQLQELGYTVLTLISNAEEALEYLEETNGTENFPDIIISDIALAGKMNGLEASKIINQKYDCVVIISTGVVNLQRIEEVLANHPALFIFKPFDTYLMHISIQMAIYQHRLEKENKELKEQIKRLTSSSLQPQ